MRASAFAAAVVLLFASCGGHEESDYFPLVKGSERTMRLWTRVVAAGETTATEEVRVVEQVLGEEEIPGVGQVWVVVVPNDSGGPTRSLYRRTEDAVMEVSFGEDSQPVEITLLSLPLTPGLRWYDTERQGQVSEVVARDTLAVGQDTFPDCYAVLTRGPLGDSARLWLAPDVGPVQWERCWALTGRDGKRIDVVQRAELVKYERPREVGPIP